MEHRIARRPRVSQEAGHAISRCQHIGLPPSLATAPHGCQRLTLDRSTTRRRTKGSGRNKVVRLSVEAPARQGARSAHAGRMQATSNADRRDASVVKVATLFRPEP